MNKSSPHKVLVVDDDQRLRDLLRRYLSENGFTVFAAESPQAMNKLWLRERFDVLILDLMMPGEDGLSVLRRLRASNDPTPVIMLTAKGGDVDRIVGLEMGADDYLAKPFNPRELLARINAVLRRKAPAEAPGAPSQDPVSVSFGEFTLDLATRSLSKAGEAMPLTTGEFAVLKVFARHPKIPAVAREAHGDGARPRVRSLRPQPGRADIAAAQAHRARSGQAAVHPDRLGAGVRLRARRRGLMAGTPAGTLPAGRSRPSGLRLRSPPLFWRTFLLIVSLTVASLVAWVPSVQLFEREPRAHQLADQVVSIVHATRIALVYSDPDRRRQLLADLLEDEKLRVVPLEPSDTVEPIQDSALLRLVEHEVRLRLGPNTRLASQVNGVGGFWVSFAIDEDAYWVFIDRDLLRRDIGHRWIASAVLATTLSLLVAIAIARLVNRPLAQLSRAARDLGAGRVPGTLPDSGPIEIRTVNQSFNRMVSDLQKLDRERAVLLAGVSHDLRTPLTRLRLELEMSDLPASSREAMIGDLEQMDSIVRQFLDYARPTPERGRETVDLSLVVREALARNRLAPGPAGAGETAHRADVRLDLALEDGVCVPGYPHRAVRARWTTCWAMRCATVAVPPTATSALQLRLQRDGPHGCAGACRPAGRASPPPTSLAWCVPSSAAMRPDPAPAGPVSAWPSSSAWFGCTAAACCFAAEPAQRTAHRNPPARSRCGRLGAAGRQQPDRSRITLSVLAHIDARRNRAGAGLAPVPAAPGDRRHRRESPGRNPR